MKPEGVTYRHFILGLLAQKPMSGYDINRYLKGLGWLIGMPSFGSLYPALHALRDDGLVTVDIVPSCDKPARKIYSISDRGRQELAAWSELPALSGTPLKAFVMRLILSGSFSRAQVLVHLEQRRARVAEHVALMEQMAAQQREAAEPGHGLALDYGLALAAAELDWLDRTLARL